MKTRGENKYCFRLGELAKSKGISKVLVSREIKEGKFNPNDPESVCGWLSEPFYRKNKGKTMPWLEGKRGRRKNAI